MRYNVSFFASLLKIILITTSFLTFKVYAQNKLQGRVNDASSGLPLPAAYVKNLDTKAGTITNDTGFFELEILPGNRIEYGKTGYQVQTFTYTSNFSLNLTLNPVNKYLEEVVVSASRGDQALKNTSVSMEVIKPYIINNKNPATMENAVDQIPGVQTVNGQVVIRGGSGWSYGAGSRVTVMVDGMPMLSGDAGQVQWSFLPVENVESMEVIKGASSVLFGSSALSGVINIRTQKPGNKPETKVSTFFGTYNKAATPALDWNGGKRLFTSGIRAFHSQREGKNSITLNLNAFNDDGYRMSDEDRRVRLGVQYRRDLPAYDGYFGINSNLQKGKSSSFLLWENNEKAYTALDSSFTKNRTLRFNIDPVLYADLNGWKHLIQGRYLKIDNEILDVSQNNSQSNYSNAYYGEYQLSHALNNLVKFTTGAVINFAQTESPLYQGKQTSRNLAGYLQLNGRLGLWNFDAGIRYESYKLNSYKESKPVMRAGVSRALAKATFLRGSFGQGYRFPTIAESYVLTAVGPIRIYPNQDLKSESGWNAELGLKQGLKTGKVYGLFDIALFWMEYQRMMEFTFAQWEQPSASNPLPVGFKSLNVANAKILGVDMSLAGSRKWKNSEIKVLGGYTYSHGVTTQPDKVFYTDSTGKDLTFRNTSSNPEGNYLKYRPKHLVRLDIQYEIKKWEIGISGRYNSYMQNIDLAFVSIPIVFAVPGIQTVRDKGKNGDYVIDLRFGKTYKSLKALILINNLLNRQYMTRPADMRPPRSFMLQLTWAISSK